MIGVPIGGAPIGGVASTNLLSDVLSPPLFVNTNSFNTQLESLNLAPTKFTNTNTFGTPVVSKTGEVNPIKFTNTNTFFTPSLTTGDIRPTKFTNTNAYPTTGNNGSPMGLLLAVTSALGSGGSVSFNENANVFTNTNTFGTPLVTGPRFLTAALFENTPEIFEPVVFAPDSTPVYGRPFTKERRQIWSHRVPVMGRFRR